MSTGLKTGGDEMKSLTLLFIFSYLCLSTSAQVIKEYQGTFKYGNATYEYYENDKFFRIYHGSFKYEETKFIEGWGQTKIIITGNFKNNVKDGFWSYQEKSDEFHEVISGQYSNGLYDGKWIGKTTLISTKEIYYNEIITFINGVPYGDYYYTWTTPSTIVAKNKREIIGSFDQNGRPDGTWIEKYWTPNKKLTQTSYKFKHGLKSYHLQQDMSTGEILSQMDRTDFVNKAFQNLGSDSITVVRDTAYIIYSKGHYFISSWFNYSGDSTAITDIIFSKYLTGNGQLASNHLSAQEIISSQNYYLSDRFQLQFDNYFQYKDNQQLMSNRNIIIKSADSLFTVGEFGGALNEYSKANKMFYSEEIDTKINLTKIEIEKKKIQLNEEKRTTLIQEGDQLFLIKKYYDSNLKYKAAIVYRSDSLLLEKIAVNTGIMKEIEKLKDLRLETYKFIQVEYLQIDWKLKVNSTTENLDAIKKIYAESYQNIMLFLSQNFANYINIINTYFLEIKSETFLPGYSWEDKDQYILDNLISFKKEIIIYRDFHFSVIEAIRVDDKTKLKLLKSSNNPEEIVSKFISF